MREDGAAHFLGIAALFQNLGAFVGVVVGARIFFVIEVVEKADQAPQFFVGSGFAGVGAHACLDREGMFPKTFRRGELS